jgi:hypothetical protein
MPTGIPHAFLPFLPAQRLSCLEKCRRGIACRPAAAAAPMRPWPPAQIACAAIVPSIRFLGTGGADLSEDGCVPLSLVGEHDFAGLGLRALDGAPQPTTPPQRRAVLQSTRVRQGTSSLSRNAAGCVTSAIWGSSARSDTVRFSSLRTPVTLARPPDYDESSARRDHHVSAAVIALSASWIPSPTSPAVAAQCRGTRARAPASQRCSSRVNGSGAVLS